MTQSQSMVAFRDERRRRLRDAEARQGKSILDKARVRAKHIIADAQEEAKLQAKNIILEAERRASIVTEQAYNLGLAKADAKVLANERRRRTLEANKKRISK